MIIGSHVSYTKDKGLLGSLEEALSYNSTTFMFYTGAPQNTIRYKIDKELTKTAIDKMESIGMDYSKVIVHAPYIINLANRKDEDKFLFSVNFLKEEIRRCMELGIKYMVLHPGCHVNEGIDVGIKNIIDGLNMILPDSDVTILLETMAGKGSECGKTFEELKTIIDNVNNKDKIGVCLDTCHLNDSGYDLNDFDKLLDQFDEIVGLSYVHCIHINDSKNERGSHKDRHENIGYGTIGFNTLINIIYNDRLKDIPKILETPYINKLPPYKEEIDMILKKEFNKNLKQES